MANYVHGRAACDHFMRADALGLRECARHFLSTDPWRAELGAHPPSVLVAWVTWSERQDADDPLAVERAMAQEFGDPGLRHAASGELVLWSHVAEQFQAYLLAVVRHAVYVTEAGTS